MSFKCVKCGKNITLDSNNKCNECGYDYKALVANQFLFDISPESMTSMKRRKEKKKEEQYMNATSSYGKTMFSDKAESLYQEGCQCLHEGHIETAKEKLIEAVNLGNVDAFLPLGVIYYDGLGDTQKDLEHAFRLFDSGAKKGNKECSFNVALMICRGLGTKLRSEQGQSMMRQLEREGMLEAGKYIHGKGRSQIIRQSAKKMVKSPTNQSIINDISTKLFDFEMEFQKAYSSRGFLPLGSSSNESTSVYRHVVFKVIEYYLRCKNYEQAYAWISFAAKRGNSDAMFWLGTLYESGLFVEENKDSAIYWYIQSIKHNARSYRSDTIKEKLREYGIDIEEEPTNPPDDIKIELIFPAEILPSIDN